MDQMGFIPSLGYRHFFIYQMNEKTSVWTFQWIKVCINEDILQTGAAYVT